MIRVLDFNVVPRHPYVKSLRVWRETMVVALFLDWWWHRAVA